MTFDPRELRARPRVADGGWSTILRGAGLPLGLTVPEEMNIAAAPLVANLAKRYVEAGAEFLTTNTFGANRIALARRAAHADAGIINRRGAEIARAAVGDRPITVCGTIGPTGALVIAGEQSDEALHSAFAEAALALVAGGVDAILLETFSELSELQLAIAAVRDACALPIIASMSFDSGPQRTRTVMGVTVEAAATALDQLNVDVVGCNCGGGVSTALPAVVALRAVTNRPLWVKPSAGPPEWEDGHAHYPLPPEDFARAGLELVEAGADMIGGCCGVGPEAIARIAALVRSRSRRSIQP